MGEAWLEVVVKREVTEWLQSGDKTVTIREKRMTRFFAENGLTFFVKYDIMEVRPCAGRAPAQGGMTNCPGVLVKKITFKRGLDFLKILCYTIYRN